MPKSQCPGLGLAVCREALGVVPASLVELPAMSGAAVVRYLEREGLLTEVDADSSVLPLGAGGRAEVRAAQRRHRDGDGRGACDGRGAGFARAAGGVADDLAGGPRVEDAAELARRICASPRFRWGDLLAFARVLRLAGLEVGPTAGSGPTARSGPTGSQALAAATELARLIDPSLPEQGAAARRRARRLLRVRCQGAGSLAAVGIAAVRIAGVRTAGGGLGPVDDPANGNRPAAGPGAVGRSAVRWSIDPDPALARLVDEVAAGRLRPATFAPLDVALRADALGPEERCVLPLVAPLLDVEFPEHPMGRLVLGFARRQQFNARAVAAFAGALEGGFLAEGIPVVALGGATIGRRWYRDPGVRSVAGSRFVVPAGTRRGDVRRIVAEAAGALQADVTGRCADTVTKFGVGVSAGVHAAPDFAFPSAGRRIWGSTDEAASAGARTVEDPVLLYLSIVESMLGAPTLRWYTDAVMLRMRLGSDEAFAECFGQLEGVARDLGWNLPVVRAADALRARGWPVAVPALRPDRRVDEVYWASRAPVAEVPALTPRLLLSARLLAHGARSAPC